MWFIVLAERMDCRGVFGGVVFCGDGAVVVVAILGQGWQEDFRGRAGFWRGVEFRGDSMANRRGGGFSRGKSIIYII